MFGFAIAVLLSQSRWIERGVIPYVVASQTVPLLAIAPMVVVGLGSKGVTDWVSVAILAAYLTFFPVTINVLRGLGSADPRGVELMRSYAGGRWQILWKLRVPTSIPFLFSALRIAAPLSIVGAIISEPAASIQGGLGGAIVNFNQYYSIEPQELWATNVIAAILGIAFFLAVVVAEKLDRAARAGARRMSVVELSGVTKTFARGNTVALEGIDLTIEPGELVSLIGPSGCGKSTLLRIIGDLVEPSARARDREREDGAPGPPRPRLRDRLPGRRALRLAHGREEHRAAARDARLEPRAADEARAGARRARRARRVRGPPSVAALGRRGKRIGVPEWAHTAAVYMRGWLMHEGGVALSDIDWVQAGTNEAGRIEKVELTLPKGVKLTAMPDKTLSGMIASGELDCVIIARPPNSFREKHPDVVRLFPDYEAMEQRYYEDTRVYPIMHVIALRKAILDGQPWVARNLYNAFEESKRRSLERILDPAVSRYPVPWLTNYATRMRRHVRRRIVPLRHRGQPADAGTVPALCARAGHRAQARQAGRHFPRRHHGVGEDLRFHTSLTTLCRLGADARRR